MRLISESRPVARKQHACITCRGVAARPGEPYVRAVWTDGGRAWTYIQCAPCIALTNRVGDWVNDCESFGEAEYSEWAFESERTDRDAAAYLARRYPGGLP